jgi:hypothetical protein
MELEPPAFSIIFRDTNCPKPMNTAIGRTQDSRKLVNGDICSMISPEKIAPEPFNR